MGKQSKRQRKDKEARQCRQLGTQHEENALDLLSDELKAELEAR